MSSLAPCIVCGGVEYEKQSGYFVCQECHTQSQDVQEQSFQFGNDTTHVAAADNEKEEIISQKIEEERKLTSWECFTIILRSLVDELIELGVDSQLRKVAFQLWVCCLRTENIAFFSQSSELFPCLQSSFKNKDIEIMYKVKNFRKMYLQDLQDMCSYRSNLTKKKISDKKEPDNETELIGEASDTDASGSSRHSTRSIRQKQRKLAMFDLNESEDNDGNSTFLSDTETLDSLERSRKKKKGVTIAFKSSTVESMEKLKRVFAKVKQRYKGDIPSNVQSWFDNRIYNRNRILEQNYFTMSINTVIVILRIALLLIEDPIQWADLFRWACEGRLSLNQVQKFLPKDVSVRTGDLQTASRATLIQTEMTKMTSFLRIEDLTIPNIFKLVQRYAFELCLPDEFLEFTQKIIALFPPSMNYSYSNDQTFPDCECRAMAYVLFVFKILFSLDDVTETKQSKFADAINKQNQRDPPLFSWTSWIRYIRCRATVLCKYNVSMNHLYKGEETTDVLFLEHWKNTQPDTGNLPSNRKIDKHLMNELNFTANRLKAQRYQVSEMSVDFPSSLTPYRSYIQLLLMDHRDKLSERSYDILSTNFNSHTIKYLLDRKWAASKANDYNLDVEFIFEKAAKKRKIDEVEPESNVPRLSKYSTIPAPTLTNVCVLKDEEKNNLDNDINAIGNFQPTFQLIDSTIKEEKHDSFKLYYPSSVYWLFHTAIAAQNESTYKEAEEKFSTSFLWLLSECSRMIRCELKELYKELTKIEFMYACLFGDDDEYAAEAPFKLQPNEW